MDNSTDFKAMSNYSPIQAMIDRQADVWRRNQEAYVAAWEATVNSWLRHGQEAIAAAAETAEQASRCRDLVALAELQQQWFAGALTRLTADMTALAENAMTLSQRSLSVVAAFADEAGAPSESEPAGNHAWAIAPSEGKAKAEPTAPPPAPKAQTKRAGHSTPGTSRAAE
jgi:hypothetical protein